MLKVDKKYCRECGKVSSYKYDARFKEKINRKGDKKQMRGTVKWFNSEKGYGFIINEEGQDVFVHYTGIESDGFKTLNDGDNVEFTVQKTERGWQAFDVKVTKESNE